MTIAIYGTGSIGLKHAAAARELGMEPLLVPVRSDRKAPLVSEGYRVADSIGQAKALGAVAAVIATNTGRHLSDLDLCLDLGLHVLVEKPAAPDMNGIWAAMKKAEALSRRVSIAMCLRWEPSVSRARQWVVERAGKVHAAEFWCNSYLPDWRPGRNTRQGYWSSAEEGGVLRDLLHELDLDYWINGKTTRIAAVLRNCGVLGIESEEVAAMLAIRDDAVSSTIYLDYLTRPSRRGFRISGREGCVEWDGIEKKASWCSKLGDREEFKTSDGPQVAYVNQLRQFISLTEGNPAADMPGLADALSVMAVCDAARTSSLTANIQEVRELRG